MEHPEETAEQETEEEAARRAEMAALINEMEDLRQREKTVWGRVNEMLGLSRIMADEPLPQQGFTWPCWVDEEPCPVGIAAAASIALAQEVYQANPNAPYAEQTGSSAKDIRHEFRYYLACPHCPRPAQRDLEGLRGLRLGARERRILCAAPGPDEEGRELARRDARPSVTVAQQRARRGLEKAGLLHTRWRGSQPGFGIPAATLSRLSPLGAAVVTACRPELESGGRIRWDRKMPQITALLPAFLRDPVRETGRRMAESTWSKLAARLAPVLCPDTAKDP